MSSSLSQLLSSINTSPEQVDFARVMEVINEHYQYTATRFYNGLGDNQVINEAETNEGSCRLFAFAQLHQLSQEQTLHCFGDYYRNDVLENPEGSDHGNIRAFMRDGWEGIRFDQPALSPLSEQGV